MCVCVCVCVSPRSTDAGRSQFFFIVVVMVWGAGFLEHVFDVLSGLLSFTYVQAYKHTFTH